MTGLLCGCIPKLEFMHEAEARLSRAEWMVRPREEAWVQAPQTRLPLERRAGGLSEQRLDLPNRTSLRGANMLHIRAVTGNSRHRFDLDRTLALLDGVPYPFTRDDLNGLRTRDDAAGTLSWAEWTDGAGTTCVLALRRLDIGVRVLPEGTRALDLVMRNCVRGEAEDALAPAGAALTAFPATPGMAEGVALRTIAPLAAPGL